MSGYSCHNLGGQVWRQQRTVQRLLNISCSCDLLVCSGIRMVMGPAWVDSPKRDISIGDPISRAEHHSFCEPSLHIHNCSGISVPPLFIQVRDLPVLCWLDYHYDLIRLCVPT
ncbi:hypothetical protein S245_002374 [Arachis hypogaea]